MMEIRHEMIHDAPASRLAYDRIYKTNGILQRDSFYLWILAMLKPYGDEIILDVSCGEGRLVALARKKTRTAYGIDFSLEAVRSGRLEWPVDTLAVGDGECLPFASASIHCVANIGSLEHFIHPLQGVKEMARVLRPDGRACILLPNAFGLFGNIRQVFAAGEIFDDGQPLQRYATRRTWEALLIQGGLKVDRVLAYHEVRPPRTKEDVRWFVHNGRKLFRWMLSPLIPLNLSNQFVFLCSRK